MIINGSQSPEFEYVYQYLNEFTGKWLYVPNHKITSISNGFYYEDGIGHKIRKQKRSVDKNHAVHFCIECNKETRFFNWLCNECGCHSPDGDPCDDEITSDI